MFYCRLRERDNNTIGKSLEANINISPKDSTVKDLLIKYNKYLNEIFIVSKVIVEDKKDDSFIEGDVSFVKTIKAEHEKCVRCWGHYETVGENKEHKELCARCVEALK